MARRTASVVLTATVTIHHSVSGAKFQNRGSGRREGLEFGFMECADGCVGNFVSGASIGTGSRDRQEYGKNNSYGSAKHALGESGLLRSGFPCSADHGAMPHSVSYRLRIGNARKANIDANQPQLNGSPIGKIALDGRISRKIMRRAG